MHDCDRASNVITSIIEQAMCQSFTMKFNKKVMVEEPTAGRSYIKCCAHRTLCEGDISRVGGRGGIVVVMVISGEGTGGGDQEGGGCGQVGLFT